MTSPTTVIWIAAGTLPFANPVQAIVMPLVGSSAASIRPSARYGCPGNQARPIAYATKGITPKLIACASHCARRPPPCSSCRGCSPTIIG